MIDEKKKNLLKKLVDLIPGDKEKEKELPELKQFEFEWFDLIYLPIGILLIVGVLWVLFKVGILSKTKHDEPISAPLMGDPALLAIIILMVVAAVGAAGILIIHFTKELITFVSGVEL